MDGFRSLHADHADPSQDGGTVVPAVPAPRRTAAGSGSTPDAGAVSLTPRREPPPRPADRRWWPRRPPAGPSRSLVRLRGAHALAALDAADDAIIAVDDQGRCAFANAAGATLFGRSAQQLAGSDVQLLVPRLAVAVQALIAERSAGGGATGTRGSGVELHGISAGGATFPARVWLTVLVARRRVVVLATIRDLSAQRAGAAATRALLDDVHDLRAVVAGVSAALTERGLLIMDELGHLTSFNRAAEKLIGRSAEEVVGRPLAELSDPDDLAAVRAELRLPPGVDPLLEITRSGLPNHQDWSFLSREGDRRPLVLRITAIGDPRGPIGFVCVARERSVTWEPLTSRPTSDRLLLDLDDAETRTLRWQVGGSGYPRRR